MSSRPTYPKIPTVFTRDPTTNFKTLIDGQYTLPTFEYLAYLKWVWTEKVDGTNIRLHVDVNGMSFGGRTLAAQIPRPLTEYLIDLSTHPYWADLAGLTVFGEGYGAGIQKGGGYGPEQRLIVFDVMVTDEGWFLKREDVGDIACKLGLPHVPVVGTGSLEEAVESVRLRGPSVVSRLRDGWSEGLVLRPATELLDRLGQRVIAKIKVKDCPEHW